ncbi:hypothetical protein BX600DRAFT_432173 [Xylariales sp. PMI_506]|nr:hypothetical protein BX600DRAFT_432173 [Xylariales sp. PMI_506]
MHTASVIAAALLPAAYTAAQSTASTTTTDLFVYGAAPRILDASVVTRYLTTWSEPYVSYVLDCPATSSPENDACRALSQYPAGAWHIQGSVWGGTITASADQATTTWECALGGPNTPPEGATALCTLTAVGGTWGTVATTTTVSLGSCAAQDASIAVVITAGLDQLPADSYSNPLDVSQKISAWDAELSSLGCPTRPTLGVASTPTTAVATTGTGVGTGSSQAVSTGSAAASSASPSASPSASGTAGSSGVTLQESVHIVGTVVASLAIAFGVLMAW